MYSSDHLDLTDTRGLYCTAVYYSRYLIAAHRVTGHFYTDDSQLYVISPVVDVESTVSQLMACLVDVNDWMRGNRLRLNADKTWLIWLGSQQELEKINVADVQFVSESAASSQRSQPWCHS